ncbi:hypothetical protein [Oceanotoga teriensis]|uniref:hypothetical protein n=1 Tax=Oceanotoga teriensis TaxID=515440 RepID=UPI00272E453C|nr:hypothetical protein [Oceanotoga teriensis]
MIKISSKPNFFSNRINFLVINDNTMFIFQKKRYFLKTQSSNIIIRIINRIDLVKQFI